MSLTGNIERRAIKAEDDSTKPSPIFQKQKSTAKRENKAATQSQSARSCSFRLPTTKALTPLKHLKYVGSKAVGVLRMLSAPKRNSPKVTSSERGNGNGNGNAIVANLDSQSRAQAIDDCIEFINSSSLTRSKSISH